MSKVGIKYLREGDTGIDVYTNNGLIKNVSENVVRCALGSDVEYLLKTKNDESHCFSVLESEYNDFLKYRA